MSLDTEEMRIRLSEFLEHSQSNPLSSDDSPLRQMCLEVETEIDSCLTPELVHLADDIYRYLGQDGLEKRISLHRTYIDVAPNVEERFWSNWHLVDTLAVMRRNSEAIEEQKAFYKWAREELTVGHMVKTLYDSTQARCWVVENQGEDWFKLYYNVLGKTESAQIDRQDLCIFIRTGSEVAAMAEKFPEAMTEVNRLGEINQDPEWKHYIQFWLGAITTKLEVYRKQSFWDQYDQLSEETISLVERNVITPKKKISASDLAWVAHDLGVCLLWAKRYKQAKRLLEIAMEQEDSGGTHFFFAACIWASEKDRSQTLYHLRYAQQTTKRNVLNRGGYYKFFLNLPEFEDVKDDADFLEVLGQRSED